MRHEFGRLNQVAFVLNAGSARKCKVCDAPNPTKPSRKRLKREKPTETALDIGQTEASAQDFYGAGEQLIISEFRFADGLIPAGAEQPKLARSCQTLDIRGEKSRA